MVLLITHAADHFTIDHVAAALAMRGARPLRVDIDRFPGEIQLGLHGAGNELACVLVDGPEAVNAAEVSAVWMRRWVDPVASDLDDGVDRDTCVRSATAAFDSFLAAVPKTAIWIDHRERQHVAANRLHQLRVATRHRLRSPSTLISNSPDEVRAFAATHGGSIVAKLPAPPLAVSAAPPEFFKTRTLSAAELPGADTLATTPLLLQERILGEHPLRVVFVAGKFFVARKHGGSWVKDEVPGSVKGTLAGVMHDLGLSYGTIDLMRTLAGEHVFLELDPTGEWGMLERDLGYPISKAIAGALLGK